MGPEGKVHKVTRRHSSADTPGPISIKFGLHVSPHDLHMNTCWSTQLDFFQRLYYTLRGCCPLKFLHALQYPKLYFQSDLGPGGLKLGSTPYFWHILVKLLVQQPPGLQTCSNVLVCEQQLSWSTTFVEISYDARQHTHTPTFVLSLISCTF